MSILIGLTGNLQNSPEFFSWVKVLSVLQLDGSVWNIESKPAFDAFDEFCPSIFICKDSDITEAICKCINEIPELTVIIKTEKPLEDKLDLLKKIQPSLIYSNDHIDFVKEIYSSYLKEGLRVESVLSFADVLSFSNSSYKEGLSSDVCHVGGLGDNSEARSYLCKLCYPVGKYNVKLFNDEHIPTCQNLGMISPTIAKDIYRSSKVCPVFASSDSCIPREFFDIVVSGGNPCISSNKATKKVFGTEVKQFSNFNELVGIINSKTKTETTELDSLMDNILNNHTSFHRMAYIFSLVGLTAISQECMNLWAGIQNSGGISNEI